jgi:hypothetical protein
MGLAMVRIAAVGIAAFTACSAAGAAELREVTIDFGPSDIPMIATARVEDYRAAPLDLLAPAATDDSAMTRLMKMYFEISRAGDTNRVAAIYEPHVVESVSEDFAELAGLYANLRSARLSAVLHWGEYQSGIVEHESAIEGGDTQRWWVDHIARCSGGTCQLSDSFENSLAARMVARAFAEKGAAQLAMRPRSDMLLPIFPVMRDAAQKSVGTDPIVLYLNRSSDQTQRAVVTLVSTLTEKLRATSPEQPTFDDVAALYSEGTPEHSYIFESGNWVSPHTYSEYVTWFTGRAPWTVSAVYSLGPDFGMAVLKSDKDRALHLLPLQRVGPAWTIISNTLRLGWWQVLSSPSAHRALQGPIINPAGGAVLK